MLRRFRIASILGAALTLAGFAAAQNPPQPQPLPPGKPTNKAEELLKGYDKVVSTADGKPSMFTLYVDRKKAQVLAELPKDLEKKKYFIALTVASGERFAGLQAGDLYVYWKRYGDRLALIEPDLTVRSTGDLESKKSVERLFTGRVLADIPILATQPRGDLLIDLDELLLGNASKFFELGPRGLDARAVRIRAIKTIKAFPENVELAFEVPMADGKLKSLHFSLSEIPDHTGYKVREADDRVGYFTTAYDDLGKFKAGQKRVRYINRWHLEKADPSLRLSPPREPIVFYIEHTTPIRYRRFVREGVLYWNQAFERIGLANAIEVHYQDAVTGAHMEKDPEDVRYNFLRWLNNDISTAIGPSRVHPLTGQILDADIVLTDGWIRYFERAFSEILPSLAMEGFGPETLAWLGHNPRWDPRLLLVPAHERQRVLAQRPPLGTQPLAGHPLGQPSGRMLGKHEFDGLTGRVSQVNGMCLAATGKALDLTLLRMTLEMIEAAQDAKPGDPKDPKKPKTDGEEELDGIPSRFIGPLLADLVAHEVGHTLGLRHNFKASSLYSLKEINSDAIKGKKPFAGSVMDYLPINIDMKDGKLQGDYAMIGVGPYDLWAIEYGYSFEKDLKPILAKSVEPGHQFATDQDTVGPDPLARRYDFSSDPLDYARSQMKLVEHHRERLLKKFVREGDSWSKARRGYELSLSLQTRALSMMANWTGGTFVRRDRKGDKGDRSPLEAVPAKQQRAAVKWVLEHAFRDQAFHLTPDLLRSLSSDGLKRDESFSRLEETTFPVHDRIMGIQSSVLTMLMNPSTLRKVYDNELMVPADQDALTLPELLDTLSDEIWAEIAQAPKGKYSARKPLISSLRRNLQRDYLDRLIDMALSDDAAAAASRPISTLAMHHLRRLSGKINGVLKGGMNGVDPYTTAHLEDAQDRITKALEARYVAGDRGRATTFFPFFASPQGQAWCSDPGCSRCK